MWAGAGRGCRCVRRGSARTLCSVGIAELREGTPASRAGRVRRHGCGAAAGAADLIRSWWGALEALVDPDTRGDPCSPVAVVPEIRRRRTGRDRASGKLLVGVISVVPPTREREKGVSGYSPAVRRRSGPSWGGGRVRLERAGRGTDRVTARVAHAERPAPGGRDRRRRRARRSDRVDREYLSAKRPAERRA